MEVTAKYNDSSTKVVTDYTIDKTTLSSGDSTVVVSYEGKRAIQRITVNENPNKDDVPDITISDVGTFKLEAEDLSGDYKAETSDATWTSGGLSLNYMTGGSVVKVKIKLTRELTVCINPVMAYYSTFNWEKLTITLDDIVVTPSGVLTQAIDAGSDYNKTWLNWTEVDFGSFTLSEGMHLLTITAVGADGPGMDYFNFRVFEKDAVELSSIYVDVQPTKTSYVVGDVLDFSGIVVKARYSDGSEEAITDYTIEKTGTLTEEDEYVVISYQGKTVRQEIVVKQPVPEGADVEISATGEYKVEAESLKYGPEVEDESSASGGQCTGYTPYNSVMTLKFSTNAQYQVSISAVMAYYYGYDLENKMTITLDGSEIVPITKSIATDGGFHDWKDAKICSVTLEAGEHTLSLTTLNSNKGPAVDYFTITVTEAKAASLTGIKVATPPTKIEYSEGEKFDASGMEVKAVYSDNSEETITDYTIDKTSALTPADTEITITYQGNSTTQAITVSAAYDAQISELGTVKVEAEDLLCAPATEDNGLSDGGLCSAYMQQGTEITLKFTTDKTYKVTINASMAYYFGFNLGTQMTTKIDGTEFTSSAEVGTNGGWKDWFTVEIGSFVLEAGEHTLTLICIYANGGPAIDWFTITTAENVQEVKSDIAITELGEYTVEGEALVCNPTLDSNTSNTSTSYMNKDETISLSFSTDKKYTVKIVAVMARWHGYTLDNSLAITLDGNEITTNATIPYTEEWHEFVNVEIGTFTLEGGSHILSMLCNDVGGGPGIDKFVITITEAE
jgi:hypothetical protein